jgi:hypothetical protein
MGQPIILAQAIRNSPINYSLNTKPQATTLQKTNRVQQLINNAEGIGWGGDSPSEGSFQFQAEPMNVEGQLLPPVPRYTPVPDATSPAAASPTSNRP